MPKSSASGRKIYVRIEEDTGTPNVQGGHTPTWTTVSGLDNVPAAFRTLRASQIYHLQQLYPKANAELHIRYRASTPVTTAMRAVSGSHIYMIRGAENVNQANETIVLYCEELQAVGSKR
jgi:head-tail adaptor